MEKGLVGLVFAFVLVLLVSSQVSAVWCYQESANVSNQVGTDGSCGQSYTGSYWLYEVFNSPENLYDGNWNTFGSASDPDYGGIIYINYTKPSIALNTSIWTIRDEGDGVVNLTIPQSCWDFSPDVLSLSVDILGFGGWAVYRCYTGIPFSSNNVDMYTGSGGGFDFYEEAMWWDVNNLFTPPNVTINSPLNQTYSTDEISFSVNATDADNISSCWYNIDGGENISLPKETVLCYQESANESNQSGIDGNCGQVYDGSYAVLDGFWSSLSDAYDGNFSTDTVAGTGGRIAINYTKPSGALSSSFWRTKDLSGEANFSIPSACWNYDPNVLEFFVDEYDSVFTAWYCRGTSGEVTLDSSGTGAFYEEAMYWIIDSDTYSGVNSSIGGGSYEVNFFCNDSLNSLNNSESVMFSVSTDTCTYSGSGDWVVNAADNCSITTNTNLESNTLDIEGTGYFEVLANITVDKVVMDLNAQIINKAGDGNALIIKLL